MATWSIGRLRKESDNDFLCLPVCRAVFCLIAMPLLAHAWQTAAPPAPKCQAAGQIFGWDLRENTISLKSDSGHYSEFHYDGSTTFTNGEAAVPPQALNLDDRLCVEAFRPTLQGRSRSGFCRPGPMIRRTSSAAVGKRWSRETPSTSGANPLPERKPCEPG